MGYLNVIYTQLEGMQFVGWGGVLVELMDNS